MEIITYRFAGLTPLLMANIESVNRNLPKMKLGTKPNEGDVEKIAEGMAYREDGRLCFPATAFRSSLLDGCTGQKFPGSRQGPKNLFKPLIFPAEDRALLVDADGQPITKFEAQIDSAVNGTGKSRSRVIAVRARVDEWFAEIPFEIDDEFAPVNFDEFLDIVQIIWNRAGRVVGVGAWRPQCEGRFGKYSVERVG